MKDLFRSVLCLTLCWTLLACSSTGTRVILLPEGGGKSSAVEVRTDFGSQVLSQPYQTAEVSKAGKLVVSQSDPLAVMDRFGALMSHYPAMPEQFLLYFETGGVQLTADSVAKLPLILEHARARKGGEIVVIGHTDRVGSVAANDALSLKRAAAVRELLIGQGFKPGLIDAVGRGERSPLVPTADEVAEPKNRRTEIIVR